VFFVVMKCGAHAVSCAADKMDLRAGRAPAWAVYGTAASLSMLAENEIGPFDGLRAISKVEWLPGHDWLALFALGPRAPPAAARSRCCAPARASTVSETAVLLLDDPAMAEG